MAERQPLQPVYLLAGSDRPKIERALERLRARFGEGAVELLSAHDARGEDAVAACNALGLFGGGHRLVVVDGVERWKSPDIEAVAAYLENPTPGSVLALVAPELRRDAPLAKACGKAGKLLVYDVSRRDLPRWVGEQFSRLGADADATACRALVDVVGDDLRALAGEAEKLALWAAGEPIDEQAVELLAAPHGEAPVFALTDAWGARDRTAVLAACEAALERSSDPLSARISRLIGALTQHVGRVAKAQRLAAEGVRPRDAMKALDARHPFVAEKAFAHARNYSPEELEDAVVRLAELDLAVKGASRLPARLELERALVAITETRAAARPA